MGDFLTAFALLASQAPVVGCGLPGSSPLWVATPWLSEQLPDPSVQTRLAWTAPPGDAGETQK